MVRPPRAFGALLLVTACELSGGGPEDWGGLSQELGTPLPSCSDMASSGYDTTTKLLSLGLGSGVTNISLAAAGGEIQVNGWPCVSGTGVVLTTTTVSKISITGTGAAEKVIVDLGAGPFGNVLSPTKGGILVDLAGGADQLTLIGSAGADKQAAGLSGPGDAFFELTGDTKADLKATAVETFTVSLAEGNDTFQAMGGAISATHLDPSVSSLSAMTASIEVFGGDGNDSIQGGAGADELHGGDGNDTFKTSATDDGGDVYDGGAGVDLVDYAARTTGVEVSIAEENVPDADDGLPGEGDDVEFSVESLTGGSGNDVLTGSSGANVLTGGAGNDVLSGGPGGSCASDVDSLSGGDGNDVFDMGSASDCADSVIGGPGTDTADYQKRSLSCTITVDATADDGETAEGDKISTDVEVVLGGSGDDTITGGSNADEIHGGAGDDTLRGGLGDDTLVGGPGNDTMSGDAGNDVVLDSGSDTAFNPAQQRGAGNDVINGGAGNDTASYVGRTAAVSVTLCVDSTDDVGAPSSTAPACTDADGEASEADNLVNIERLIGGAAGDHFTGGSASETFEGNGGDDQLSGGGGEDTLWGDSGDDTLSGDAGEDHLDGGSGNDSLSGGTGDGDICIPDAADAAPALGCELLG